MVKKYISEILTVLSVTVLVFGISYVNIKNTKIVDTSGTVSEFDNLSNSKIEWGLSRGKNHVQPDVGTKNKNIMEKYNEIYMGNSEKPYIYLTFDLGYEAGYTEKILEVLKQNEVTATFFITAHYVNSAPEIVQKMIDYKQIIGNHTVNHKSMPSCNLDTIKTEVMDLHTAVFEKFNYEMKYIRPPKGEYSEKTVVYCNSLGYKTVMWSFAYDDWDENKQGREEYGKSKIMENLHNGEVMLLHATSKDNSNILDECIKEIKAQGYEFRAIDKFEK